MQKTITHSLVKIEQKHWHLFLYKSSTVIKLFFNRFILICLEK